MGSKVRPTEEKSQQDQALDLYLEGLLMEGEPDKISEKQNQSPDHQPRKIEQAKAVKSAAPSKPAVVVEKSGKNLSAERSKTTSTKSPQQKNQLQHRSSELKLLSFKIGSLTFSTLLSDIGGAVSYTDGVAALTDQPDWLLGLLQYKGTEISIADSGRLVNHGQPSYNRSPSSKPYSTILLLDGGQWGLACDGVGEIVRISKEDVQWREQKEKMPWLMGMIKEPPMALIDLRSLIPL